jgi:hypothetical protein
MARAAVFVDAGYLFGGGSRALVGEPRPRRELALLDVPGLLRLLVQRAAGCCGHDLGLLRTYWYDGAVDGVPAPEQVAVADLPRVKLRLGRLTGGGQKGVDGLIILDLINLAANRAVDVAVLVSGDEDLREAALYAQGFGVTLVVAGFGNAASGSQSALLLREADHLVHLSSDDIAPHLVPYAATAPGAPDEAERPIVALCRGLVEEARSHGGGLLDGNRLTRRADKILVARLAELTGQFPVERSLLERARATCVRLARASAVAS